MRLKPRPRYLLIILLLVVGFRGQSGQDAVDIAANQIDKPYAFGADGPNAFDCSGLAEYSYAQVGITIPRTVALQATAGTQVVGAIQRGDLLFFATDDALPGVATHVGIFERGAFLEGIFESGSTMIVAPRTGLTVMRRDISTNWWMSRFLFARRISRVASVEVMPANPSVVVGNTIQLTTTAKDANGNVVSVLPANFTWSSANTATATVDAAGLVSGIAVGSTQITVTESSSGKSATVLVTVVEVNMAVRLNPFGLQNISNGPFQVEVVGLVNGQLNPTSAPADITVTLRRDVISQCSGLLFSSNRTVTVSQGQTIGGSLDAAGRDPACFTLPITTRWTVLQAVGAPNIALDMSIVPAAQLTVSIIR